MKIPAWDDERQLYTSSPLPSTKAKTSCYQATTARATSDVGSQDEDNVSSPVATTSPRSQVSFAVEADNVVHEVLPLSEYSIDEIQACWFTRGEYAAFKRNSLVTLSLNRAGDLLPNNPEHTMRGLECRTRECTDSRRILRYRATAAVFGEQARQKQLRGTIVDPQAISESYHAISWHSMYDAHVQGLADEQDCLEEVSSCFVGETTTATAEDELDIFSSLPSPAAAASSNRNSVLGRIVSIDDMDQEEQEAEVSEPLFPIAGFNSDLWSVSSSCASSENDVPAGFNLDSFFNHMPSMGIAVAAA